VAIVKIVGNRVPLLGNAFAGKWGPISKPTHHKGFSSLSIMILQVQDVGEFLESMLKSIDILEELPKHKIAAIGRYSLAFGITIRVFDQDKIRPRFRVPLIRSASLMHLLCDILLKEQGLASAIHISKVLDTLLKVIPSDSAILNGTDLSHPM